VAFSLSIALSLSLVTHTHALSLSRHSHSLSLSRHTLTHSHTLSLVTLSLSLSQFGLAGANAGSALGSHEDLERSDVAPAAMLVRALCRDGLSTPSPSSSLLLSSLELSDTKIYEP